MKRMSLLLILVMVLHVISCGQSKIITKDLIPYKFTLNSRGAIFASNADTIHLSNKQYEINKIDSFAFSKVKVDNQVFYIDYRMQGAYDIENTLWSYEGISYLDLPYGQFYLDKGAYSEQKILCTVVINKQLNKDEKKLTKQDLRNAEKRRREPISFLEIQDTSNKTIYASASFVTGQMGDVIYAVYINEHAKAKLGSGIGICILANSLRLTEKKSLTSDLRDELQMK